MGKKKWVIYLIAVGLISIGQSLGLGMNFVGNFLRESYGVSTMARAEIEIPRELPGLLCVLLMMCFWKISNIGIARIAQVLCFIAVSIFGFFTPPYWAMIMLMALYSIGMHLFFPLQEAIPLMWGEKGRGIGQVKSVALFGTMAASALIFIGFKERFFSYTAQIKWVFLAGAACYLVATVLLFFVRGEKTERKKVRLKDMEWGKYWRFYVLAGLSGAQKQIMTTFAPWVFVSLFAKDASYMAILVFLGSFVGIYLTLIVGQLIDKLGVKKMLFLDAATYIFVYLAYGILLLFVGTSGKWVLLALSGVFVMDSMSTQMGMVRSVFLRELAGEEEDVSAALAGGISVEHMLTITFAVFGGFVWEKWGAAWVFFAGAGLSLGNLIVAIGNKGTKK